MLGEFSTVELAKLFGPIFDYAIMQQSLNRVSAASFFPFVDPNHCVNDVREWKDKSSWLLCDSPKNAHHLLTIIKNKCFQTNFSNTLFYHVQLPFIWRELVRTSRCVFGPRKFHGLELQDHLKTLNRCANILPFIPNSSFNNSSRS